MRIFMMLASVPVLYAAGSLNVGGDYRGALERWLTSTADQQLAARAKHIAAITTPAQVRQRQEFVRKWMNDAIGGLPVKTSLNPRITGKLQRDGYTVEKLVFESQPRFFVTANVYVPAGQGPFPAVLGVAGHSETGKAIDTYQHVWISLAKRGILALAFDPPGQGERSEYFDTKLGKSEIGIGVREHIMAGLQCLLTGTTIARYEINDGVRAFDYLLTRSDVDPLRIGVAGNSGGGTQAAYLAVAEPRLASAVSSCYITSWETLWRGPGPQDSEQIFPNFLRDGLDFPDFLLAFAPKPIMMTTAIRDFFPIAGARATYAEADRLFRVADAPGRVGYFEYDDTHGWSLPRREAAYRWFAKYLQNEPDDPGREPAHTAEPAANLNVTSTGQVSTEFGGETVRSLNLKLAEEEYARRTALGSTPARLRQIIASKIGFVRPKEAAAGTVVETVKAPAYSVEKLRLTTEAGLDIPALLFSGKPRGSAVIWLDSAGKAARLSDIEPLVGSGETVLAIDPRGMGESGAGKGSSGYTADYQLAMRALLVGRTLPGMQATDVLRAFDYLTTRRGIDARRIRIEARGNAAIPGLLAAALEPRIAGFHSDAPVRTWMDIVRARIHADTAAVVIPGVLKDFDVPDLLKLVSSRTGSD